MEMLDLGMLASFCEFQTEDEDLHSLEYTWKDDCLGDATCANR